MSLDSATLSHSSSILDEPEELDVVLHDYTTITILIITFVSCLIVALYMNIRMLVIMIRRFEREKHYSYYPMLVLMNLLSILSLIILVAACFLPYISSHEEDNGLNYTVIVVPFIYALVTPTLIASADLILCIHRVISHRKFGPKPNKWINVIVFLILSPFIGYISFKAQVYTLFLTSKKHDSWLLVAFVAENILKAMCSVGSLLGYCLIFLWSKRRKHFDSIIRQALPISGFQSLTIIVQIIMELPVTPTFSIYERFFLDIIFSAACSVAVPLCTMMGETHKREMFYSSLCCCYCYCEPRPPPPKQKVYPDDTWSRVERQRMEEEDAKSRREKERRQRNNNNIELVERREFSSLQ